MNTIASTSAAAAQSSSAIRIGLSALGCVGDAGEVICGNFDKGLCAGGCASNCMTQAMVDHPESQAEIVLASISLLARRASSGQQILSMLPRVERVIEATSCV